MTEKTVKNYSKQEIEKATLLYFKGDALATDVWIRKYCLKDEKHYYELTPDDMHRRIARELARIESKYPNPLTEERIYETIKNFKRIIPQGSPMSGIGNDYQVVSLSNCIDGESLVYTKEVGLIKMKNIVAGQHVLTHKNRFKKVLNHWSNGVKETYCISRTFGNKRPNVRDKNEMSRYLSATPEHRVYDANDEWIEIKDLLNKQNKQLKQPKFDGDNITPTVFPIGMGKHIHLDNDFAWFIGLYLAEGGVKKKNTLHPSLYFTLNSNEIEYAEKISEFSLNNLNHEAWIQHWNDMHFIQVNIFEPELAHLMLNMCGDKFDKKRLPLWLFSADDEIKKSLLDGFLCGDGTNYETFEDDYNFFAIANPTLAYELGLLARSLGKNVRFNFQTKGKLIKNRTISTTISNKCDKILIAKSPISVEVFDMEVEDDHSFVAGDIICHNCFVIGNNGESDSYGGIMKIDQEQIQLMKRRGGVGHDLSHIRPNGSPVKNSAITSTGIVPFMERYSNSTKEVAQDGRRGALMLSVSVKHPDAERFIDAKLEQGKVTGANISVKIHDDFMNAVINGTPYTQQYPIDAIIPKITKEIDASKLWKKIIHNAWKSAEPGILYWDKVISESIPDCYAPFGFKTVSTNPCVSEDTLILTDSGYLPIGDIVDTKVNVWNGKEFSEVTPKVTGENQKMLKIMFSDGSELKCTPYHGFYTWEGFNRDGKAVKKEAKDLLVGDKLEKYDFPVLDRDFGVYLSNDLAKINSKLYYNIGFFAGDGTFKNGKPYMQLYGEKKKLIDMFDIVGSVYGSTDIDRLSFNIKLPSIVDEIGYDNIKKYVPKIQDHETLDNVLDSLSWLAGLIDSDGSRNSEEGSISISSTDREFLMNIKLHILNTFGVNGSVIDEKEGGLKEIKGHEYETNKSYRLIISAHNVKKLYDLGLRTYRVEIDDIDTDRDAARFISVVSIENIDDAEKVYCFTEPKRNRGCFGGVVTSNCGEIPLCPYDSCRLMAVNLYGYVIDPFTPNARFDMDLFKKDAIIAQRFMDDIVDLEIEKIDTILAKIKADPEDEFTKMYEINLWEQIKAMTEKGRRTGLGITAEGDMLAALGLRYGTEEATAFSEEVHKTLKLEAYRSSVIMAEERGAFPIYDWKRELDNPFINRIKKEDPELYVRMVRNGRRNIALLTIAPTGSVSIVTQTTSGVEPAFLVMYMRRRKINPQEKDVRIDFVDEEGIAWMEYPVFHHKFEVWLEVNGYNIDVVKTMTKEQLDEITKKSPYYKATSNDVDWVEKVKMQGRIQSHIDHSISTTINLPKGTTEDVVAMVYETGWRSGCKGITVYVDGSRSGVLVSVDEKKETKEEKFHENHAPKRPKRLKGEIHRFQNSLEKWIAVVGLKDGRPYEIFTGKLENGLSYLPSHVKDCEVVSNIIEIPWVNDAGEEIKIKKKRYDIEYVDSEGVKQVHTGLNHAFNPEFWNYAKLISGILRHGMPLIFVYELIESLNFKEDYINTWKNGITRTIKKYIKDGEKGKGKCPDCGSEHLEFKEGCLTCMACGVSRCG